MTTGVWLLGLALILEVPPPPRAAETESLAFQAERQAVREREAKELIALSARLAAAGRGTDAEAILAQVEPPPPSHGPFRFVPLPEVVPARAKMRPQGLANVAVAGATDALAP